MATIEEMEIVLEQRLSLIDQKLSRFHDNLGRIGSVIGKDSSYVYDVLKGKYDTLRTEVESMVNRNVGILTSMVDRADKILTVLSEVDSIIDLIESAHDDELLSVRGEVDQKMESLTSVVEDVTTVSTDIPSVISYVIPGLATYIALRLLGVSRTVSFVGAGLAALVLKGKI